MDGGDRGRRCDVKDKEDGGDRERWYFVTVVTAGSRGHSDGGQYLFSDSGDTDGRYPKADDSVEM